MKAKLKNLLPAGILFLLFTVNQVLDSCDYLKKSTEHVAIQEPYYQRDNAELFTEKVTLKQAGEIIFPLDSSVPLTTKSIHFVELNGVRCYTFINPYNRKIYVYDYNHRALVNTIPIYDAGPHNVGGHPDYLAHHFLSSDTIVVANCDDNFVFLINNRGEILKKIKIPLPREMHGIGALHSNTSKPILRYKDKIFVTSHLIDFNVEDQTLVYGLISINFSTEEIFLMLNRPALFNYGTWSGWQYSVFCAYNESENSIVASFSADPFIHRLNLSNNNREIFFVGSRYFEVIEPYSLKKYNNSTVPVPELEKYDYLVPMFDKIIYDPYRKIYLRFAYLPLSADEYANSQKKRQETVIITDTEFNKIGEYLFPKGMFLTEMFFLTEEGLHIAYLPEKHESEDFIRFALFKLTRYDD